MNPREAHDQDIGYARLIRELIYDTIRDCYEYGERRRIKLTVSRKEQKSRHRKQVRKSQRNYGAKPYHYQTIVAWLNSKRFELLIEFIDCEPEEARKFLKEVLQGQHTDQVTQLLEKHSADRRKVIGQNDRRLNPNGNEKKERRQA